MPNAAEKVPAAHAIGAVEPPKQYEPTGQMSQVELSVTEEYVPAEHQYSLVEDGGGELATTHEQPVQL